MTLFFFSHLLLELAVVCFVGNEVTLQVYKTRRNKQNMHVYEVHVLELINFLDKISQSEIKDSYQNFIH